MAKQKSEGSKELKKKIEELDDRYKRTLADYQNLEKRIIQEKADFTKFARASLLEKLLPVLDSLGKCCLHLKDKGLNLVLDQFRAILKSEGLGEIEAFNKPFDPKLMEVVEVVPGPQNMVVEEILKGYTLGNRVLRSAKVRVGRGRRS
jgi:molecular chaperone GrpE